MALTLGTAWAGMYGGSLASGAPGPPIPPGREQDVMRLVEPLVEQGFLGHSVAAIRIEADAVRLQLDGDGASSCGPEWVRAPGALQLTLGREPAWPRGQGRVRQGYRRSDAVVLGWAMCDRPQVAPGPVASDLVRRVAKRRDGSVWGSGVDVSPRPIGMLTSVTRWLGLTPAIVSGSSWLLGLLAALVLATRIGPIAGERARSGERSSLLAGLLVILVVAGAALRIEAAVTAARDGDEHWAADAQQPVFDDDHDAAVHPPVFRAAQRSWLRVLGDEGKPAAWEIRVPSLIAGIVALVLVALATWHRGRRPWAAAPFAVLACAPPIVHASVLARPYALASLFVVIAVVCSSEITGASSRQHRVAAILAAVAAGLAAWIDLLAGVGALLALVLGTLGTGWWRRMPLLVGPALVWCLALAPGAWAAATEHTGPSVELPGSAPALDAPWEADGPARHWIGGGGWAHATARVLGVGVLGHGTRQPLVGLAACLLAVGALAASVARRTALGAWTPLVALLAGWVAAYVVGLRVRNVLFVAYGTAAVYAALLGSVEWPFRRARARGSQASR